MIIHSWLSLHRQGIADNKSVNHTTLQRWATSDGITLFQVEIFEFPLYSVTLSVPNVSQTCKLVNNTLIGPEGPYKLIFKN